MDIEKLLRELSVEEKVALVSGTDFMFTNPIPKLNIPSLCMADGPHGLRKQTGTQDNGISQSEPATAFPAAVTTASSWNPENTKKMGEAIAEECRYYGVHVLLGPGANIKRNPLCGRNFEYFSEDPLLAGKMAAAEVKGIQSEGVGVCVKHFALNNSENFRFMGNSIADMRAIREIYLKVFEIIVKESLPATMMSAYNKINGTYCSENKWLLTDVLREEWGFDGLVMTDWGAMHERTASVKAGLDLEMPGDTDICRKWLLDGINSGNLTVEELDKAVGNVLKLIEKFVCKKTNSADFKAHHELSAEIAEDSAVLLKNDGSLPLRKQDRIFAVGDLFEKMRYQGSGSSMICPTEITTPKNAFDRMNVDYEFMRGYAENKLEPQSELIAEAVNRAEKYDKILIFAGLTDYVESEGGDRSSMRLPDNQRALIDALLKTGKKIILILFGGSVIELPFADKMSAILNMFLPGQNGGTATARLLFGEKCPSGKLAETWPITYGDVPFGNEFGKTVNKIYKESVYVGYRYYNTAKRKVRYPFGYGLSYTSFEYRNMQVRERENKIEVSCEIVNTGKYDGAEIVQLYVKAPETNVFKPNKELRAFAKVYLKAGENKKVEMVFNKSDLRYFDISRNDWVLESGNYELQICSDCETVKLKKTLMVAGGISESPYTERVNAVYRKADLPSVTNELFEEMSRQKIPAVPPKKPLRLESRFTDLRATFMGRILFNAVLGVARKQMKRALRLPESAERDNKIKGALFLKRILESNSIISMSMAAGKSMPYNFAQGFVNLANGRLLKGIKCFCTKIKVPVLPKEKEEKL